MRRHRIDPGRPRHHRNQLPDARDDRHHAQDDRRDQTGQPAHQVIADIARRQADDLIDLKERAKIALA